MHDAEADCDWDEDPEEAIAVVCADGRIRSDSTSVIAGVRSDHSRTEDGKIGKEPLAARHRPTHTMRAAPQQATSGGPYRFP